MGKEVGVGSGRFAEALCLTHGVDPSPALLKMAKARRVQVNVGKGEELSYNDDSFGGVFILRERVGMHLMALEAALSHYSSR